MRWSVVRREGKSTLSDLIPRFFYDIQGGAILIDRVDIRQYDIESLRGDYMGVVSQETILFNDTIANNLRLGKQDATDEEIRQAAVVANAHNFIMETEHGYQTNIGDRGMKLSGGQRQRLSIARAVLKNPGNTDSRRSDRGIGYRVRKTGAGGFERLTERAHFAGDRPPSEHDPQRRPDHRDRKRAGSPNRGLTNN